MRAPGHLLLVLFLLLAAGCATNPVTGESELALVSESTEIEIGEEQYGTSRQMEGGDFKTDPELTAYVSRVGQRLAAVSDRKLPYEFVVLNNSTPNAWALPGGKIAVNRGLLVELDNEAELAAVLGHEIVHAAARHGAKGMERGILLEGAVLATGLALGKKEYASLAVGGATLAAELITQRYGRDAEREADLYGMKYMARAGYDPQAAVTLQETFVRLDEQKRQDWLSGLFASHPPSPERVENNRRTAQALGTGGELGEASYRQAIAHLKQAKPAYDAYDKGKQALQGKRTQDALRLADRAIALEPREAQFYALRGDAHYATRDYRAALADYDEALERDPDFFGFYLQRGLTKEKLGDRAGARRDLEQSARLLPTATAMNTLGQLALAAGERDKAVSYLRQAAGSDTPDGRAAARALAGLEPTAETGRALHASLTRDRAGYLLVSIRNPGPMPVQDIRISVRFFDHLGRPRESTGTYGGVLQPGGQVLLETGLGPVRDSRSLRGAEVRILSARLVR